METEPLLTPSAGLRHRSKTAPAMATVKPPQFRSSSIVRQTVVLFVMYLTIGVVIYYFNPHDFKAKETHPLVDAFYFCIVTMSAIGGYGDITTDSTGMKLFSILCVLVGFGYIQILLSGMVSYIREIDVNEDRKRIHMKAALVLGFVALCIRGGMGVLHPDEKFGWVDSFYLSGMSVTTVMIMVVMVMMAKWVVAKLLLAIVAHFLAADTDNNGFMRTNAGNMGQ